MISFLGLTSSVLIIVSLAMGYIVFFLLTLVSTFGGFIFAVIDVTRSFFLSTRETFLPENRRIFLKLVPEDNTPPFLENHPNAGVRSKPFLEGHSEVV